MCNLSWTPHSNLEKDNYCVSPRMGCLEYIYKPRPELSSFSKDYTEYAGGEGGQWPPYAF